MNERLRQAINQAGLEPEQLADLVEVDVKTVQRWLSGRTPYARLRARVAGALGREEHELWPDAAVQPIGEDDSRREIQAVFTRLGDPEAPDWRELLDEAVEQIELLGWTLIDILARPGAIDVLKGKAASGCQVRILISGPDSVFLRAAATELGQDQEDYIGHTKLQLEVETARGTSSASPARSASSCVSSTPTRSTRSSASTSIC